MNKKKDGVSYSERLRNRITNATDSDKQRAITYLAYIGIILVSILSSALTMVFDLENFNASRFITNLSFNLAIAILGLILSWKDGQLSNRTRRRGPLYETRQLFKKALLKIVDDDSFRQWCDKLYETERMQFISTELSKVQIYDIEYLFISEEDLTKLVTEPMENVRYKIKGVEYKINLDQITEYQKSVIDIYRQGKYKFEKIPYTFFKQDSKGNSYKKYAEEQENSRKILVWSLVYRVAMVTVVSGIFALAVVNPNSAGGKQVAFDTSSRILNLFVSMFFGYTLAHDEGVKEQESLEYKTDKINQYDVEISTGIFIAKDRDERILEKIQKIKEQRIQESGLSDVIEKSSESNTIEEPKEEPGESEVVEIEMTEEEYEKFAVDKR